MKILFLDFETSDTIDKRGKRNPSPFLPENFLVSCGWRTRGYDKDTQAYAFFAHREMQQGLQVAAKEGLQQLLSEAELVVAHNAKFEIEWLLETGFSYSGKIYCTMVGEYILARGTGAPLDLDSCCERRHTIRKLGDLVEKLWDQGLGFFQMPMATVQTYGTRDVDCLVELYDAQQALLVTEDYSSLIPTVEMSNEFILCLVDMERNGICIDVNALNDVKLEYEKEHRHLRAKLEEITRSVMGDTPINIDSPEQLSQLIYSRKVVDKNDWKRVFNIGTDRNGKRLRSPRMSAEQFALAVRKNTVVLKRTTAEHCVACEGRGFLDKFNKNGERAKRNPICSACNGRGYTYESNGRVAGFKCSPTSPQDAASGGFATDKETIIRLCERLRGAGQESGDAYAFLSSYSRYNAIATYLNTFVTGIERGVGDGNILHTKLNQCITKTGRLSSTDPNFQNMPRGGTFPVKKAIVSRFPGGVIIEVDFSQLEFRIAAWLAQDEQAIKDILDRIDVHAYTASIIECNRQEAKPHTFKPLYGGSSGTEAEQRYYRAFKEKYPGITKWQQANIETVLTTGKLTIPSGRQYEFPGTRRTPGGYVVNTTQICNYPVQGFATADVAPVLTIELRRMLYERNLRSLLILNVHDNAVFDVPPDEVKQTLVLINTAFMALPNVLQHRYGIDLNVPLDGEIKIGPNWLQMKEIGKCLI